MVVSQTTSITPANHADSHRTGGVDPLTGAVGIDFLPPYNNEKLLIASGNGTGNYVSIDLSATIGVIRRFVLIRVTTTDAAGIDVEVCEDGLSLASGLSPSNGVASCTVLQNKTNMLVCASDNAGGIQLKTTNARNRTVHLEGWL